MTDLISLPGILALLFGYALGSIPFGLLLARAAGLGDVRAIGSGNIGATNVLRTGSKGLAAATLLLDVAKGTAAVIAVSLVGLHAGKAPHIAGIGAFLGHLYPAWLGFKGGKGVATYIGVLLALAWPAALVFCAVWLLAAFIWRYSSLSALIATLTVPAFYLVYGLPGIGFILIMSGLIFYKHQGNIRRLLSGEETKIGAK